MKVVNVHQNKGDGRMYQLDDVLNASMHYFNQDELAANVWTTKYALRDKEGNYLEKTPDDMHKRMAKEFARIESKYPNPMSEEVIYEYLKGFRCIVPQGSPMMGIGNDYQNLSLSNCFVIDSPGDNMSKIFDTGRSLANLSKRRGGVGLDLSELRPDGATVNNSAKTSSGAWSFADFYSNIGRMVGQNGRRAAIMLTLDIRHPDVEKFVTMKQDLTKVTGANVSIKIRDDFMEAVKEDLDYTLKWPVDSDDPKIVRKVRAREIWSLIVKSATNTAEPGVLFWDTMLKYLPAECYADVGFKHISTNPCSELILSAGDSCRLITQNLKTFVKNPFTSKAFFDFESWKDCINVAMRLSDDLVDLELEKLEKLIKLSDTRDEKDLFKQMHKSCKNGRRTGLGTHGLADALARLTMPYDSDEAMDMVDRIYKTLKETSYQTSVDLADERGTFPVFDWDKEKDNAFIKTLPSELINRMSKVGRRNISLLTNAPTGSVSILSQTSSGLEPVFRNSYTRRKKKNHDETPEDTDFVDGMGDRWTEFTVRHHNVDEWYKITENDAKKVNLPKFFVESSDIDWQRRVDLQSIMTKHIDHSISSTINLPKGTKPEVVAELYMDAWEKGCKGLTVYVDGSRSGVLVEEADKTSVFEYEDAVKRTEELDCHIHRVSIRGERWIVFVGLVDNKPYELFAGKSDGVSIPKKYVDGKIIKRQRSTVPSKYDLHFDEDGVIKDIGAVFHNESFETTSRLISALLRHKVAPNFIVDQLSKDTNERLDDFHKVVSRVLKKYIKDGTKASGDKECKECKQETLIYQEGCVLCPNCGWSRCS